MKRTIYALVDPKDLQVRYVGQCRDLRVRFRGHMADATAKNRPVHSWIRGLRPAEPIVVVLEMVENIRVLDNSVGLPSVMEAKWLKRFRRTVLNYDKKQCAAYDEFVNSPELRARYGTEGS